jgi:hypothetical protein
MQWSDFQTVSFDWNMGFGVWILFGICPPQADWNLDFVSKKVGAHLLHRQET